MAKDTPDVFELLNQIQQLKPKAIDELLAQRASIDEKLALLGHFDTKTDTNPVRQKKTAPKAANSAPLPSANYDATKECKTCRVTGHDGRAHRSQDPKLPFTPQELAEKGLAVPN